MKNKNGKQKVVKNDINDIFHVFFSRNNKMKQCNR